MRRTALFLLLSCWFAGLGLVVASPATACSCTGGTTAEFLARADVVFTGSLVSREEPSGIRVGSGDPALHVFAVDTVVKGTAHARQGVLSPASGASCGLELTGDGPVAVFATRDADLGGTAFTTLADGQYAAFLCGGTAQLTPALEAELRALAPAGPAGAGALRRGGAGTELPAGGRAPALLLVTGTVVVLGGVALLRRRTRRPRP
ncbi:hypothetical protein [Blastococcus sp. SYSU DS0539]